MLVGVCVLKQNSDFVVVVEHDARWNPTPPPKVKDKWSNTTLSMKSDKHAQHVFKLMPLDL